MISPIGIAGINLSMANGNVSFAEHLWETSIVPMHQSDSYDIPMILRGTPLSSTCLGGDVFTIEDVLL